MRSETTSPGTRSITGTRTGLAISHDLCVVPDLASESGHRELRPVLVEEAQTNTESNDHGDDHGIGAADPVNPDTNAAPSRRRRIGLRIWRNSTLVSRTW